MGFEVLGALLAQAPVEPDPELVTPGAIGLFIVMALGFAIYLLFRSMNRHLRKVELPQAGEEDFGSGGSDRAQ